MALTVRRDIHRKALAPASCPQDSQRSRPDRLWCQCCCCAGSAPVACPPLRHRSAPVGTQYRWQRPKSSLVGVDQRESPMIGVNLHTDPLTRRDSAQHAHDSVHSMLTNSMTSCLPAGTLWKFLMPMSIPSETWKKKRLEIGPVLPGPWWACRTCRPRARSA
jgi:hypothetical protein